MPRIVSWLKTILPDEIVDAREQLFIREDHELHLEDRGFLRARMVLGALLHVVEPRLRFQYRIAEALQLRWNRIIVNDSMRHLWNFPEQKMDRTNDDAGRSRHADELSLSEKAIAQHYSPNPSMMIASRASSA
jgi:hypothetical protein